MNVAIVILNYNGRHYLQQFLPSVLTFSHPERPENTSFSPIVIVADNASTDDSAAFLHTQYPDIQLLRLEKNYGFAEGYNQALRQIEADVFVLLNSDVEVTENWLSPIVTLLQSDATIAACQPKIKAFRQKTHFEHAGGSGGWLDSLGYPFCRGRIFNEVEADEGQYNDTQEVFWATGACLFVKAACYQDFEGLDGDYFAHMEEIDLCWRLRRAGFKVMVCPDSVVYHVGGGTLDESNPFKTYLNFRNNLVTLLKHLDGKTLPFLFFSRLVLDGVAGVLFLIQGKFRDIAAVLRAHGYLYAHFFKILEKRKHNQRLIERHRIGEPRQFGQYAGSLVWDFYLRKKKKFKNLEIHSRK